MTRHPLRSQHQQTQQRCTVCVLFQSMGMGRYRSSYDREMYLRHLQTAHGVKISDDQGKQAQARGDVLKV